MRTLDRLADPWALVAGGVTGGVAGATAAALAGFPVAIPVAVGVAGVVWAVKVALDALADRSPRPPAPTVPLPPRPPRGSPAEAWLVRAERAVATLHEQTESAPDAALRARIGGVDDAAAETLGDLRALAAQVTSVDEAARRIDVGRLQVDADRLRRAAGAAADPGLRTELERTAASVAEQLATARRMTTVRDTLLARMESTAIGLEGLIARLAETIAVAATSGTVDTTERRIADLTDELDGMQAGLRETEALSRQVLTPGAPGARGGPP